ncbi:MAG: hypothetical protein H7Z14_05560 [Anaerolineae bacterium]|nr:hypothetical protein [Phycisphaerae bacterium]
MLVRALMIAGLIGIVGGCASTQPSKQSCCAEHHVAHAEAPELDRAVTASALLFDPPMYADELGPELAREGRERSAFVAYEDQTTTFSYIHIDDRQTGGTGARYERRAIIDRFGSSTR